MSVATLTLLHVAFAVALTAQSSHGQNNHTHNLASTHAMAINPTAHAVTVSTLRR